jgi:diguanylate cyclase (GGDEF)-like protein/PAS domain S-box-containing protein
MHVVVYTALAFAACFGGVAIVQMLVARRSIRSRVLWNAIFVPVCGFVLVSLAVLAEMSSRYTHTFYEYVLVALTLLLGMGSVIGVTSLLRAVREQQANEDELDGLRMRYERLFKRNEMPIVVFDRHSLRIVDVNAAALALFGGGRADLLSTTFEALGFDRDLAADWNLAEGEEPRSLELRYRTREGEYLDLFVHVSVAEVAGEGLAYGIVEDVTERNAARAALLEQKELLAHLADHDTLTGLPNRRVLSSVLERAFARGQRGVPSALLFIDVDDFKQVNDVYGHQAGDVALTAVARLLETGVRAGDVVARQGGDEFAVLLEAIDIEGATAIADRLVVAVREHFPDLGLSIGVAPLAGAHDTIEVVRRADECMYEAKDAGGNRVVVFAAQDVE